MEKVNINKIAAAFPVQVLSVRKIKKNVYRILGKKRSYCLKYYSSHEQLQEVNTILQHLQQTKFKNSYRLVYTNSQQPYYKPVDNAKGGWQLTTWVRGSTPNFSDRRQLLKAATQLADFHQHAEHIPLAKGSEGRYETILEQWDKRLQNLKHWQQRYTHPAIEKAIELATQSMSALRNSPLSELIEREKRLQAIVHGDYNYPNLIRRHDGSIVLIDFENAAHDIRIRDLAHIIQRNVYKDIGAAKLLLQAYETKRPLSHSERAIVAALIAFPYQFWRNIHIQLLHHGVVTEVRLKRWGALNLSRHYSNYWYRQASV